MQKSDLMRKVMHLKVSIASIFIVIVLVSYIAICHFYSIDLSHHFNERLRVSVEKSLVEEIFNSENNQQGNYSAIQSVVDGYNKILSDLITTNQWAPVFLSSVAIISVDGIKPTSELKLDASSNLSRFNIIDSFEVQRAGKIRTVSIQTQFTLNQFWFFGWTLLIGLLFSIVYRYFPKPLFGFQHTLYKKLLDHAELPPVAIAKARAVDSENHFSVNQWQFFDKLYRKDTDVSIVNLIAEVIQLPSNLDYEWFDLAINLEKSLAESILIGLASDRIEINLSSSDKLLIHGLSIPIGNAPLAYYAFYLKNRKYGDGWITNPRTVNTEYQEELVELLEVFGGDSRSLNKIENENGITAKMLTDMRSKITTSVSSLITDAKLNSVYLFESRDSKKNAGAKDFRVTIDPDKIILP
jgi:hypothetical protein